MKKKLTTVPFKDTQQQKARLDEVIEKYKGTEGTLMPVMQEAQEIYGYLPAEVQNYIAAGMDVPASEIYGIASFYSQFLLNPKGEYTISVCLGTACYVKGSGQVIEKLSAILGIKTGEMTSDRKFSLDATRCIGACGLAPVLTINEDVYGRLVPNQLEEIVAKYR